MPVKLCFVNGKIVTPYRIIASGYLKVDGERITDLGQGVPTAEGYQIYDLQGDYIMPGFIDLHSHGGGGYETMDGIPEAFWEMSKFHAKGGTTSLMPSTSTLPFEDLYRAIDGCAAAQKEQVPGARILGLHLEGPYFSPAQVGAQDPRFLKHPDPEEYKKLLDYSSLIKRVSAAPELPGGFELGRELRKRGIIASVAHSDATFEEMIEAVEAGYSMITHLYSGTSTVKRVNAYRIAGVVEASLYADELTVEIIGDGKHLPVSLLKLIYKCKGPDRIILCTDSMRAAGLDDGEYMTASPNGQKFLVDDGVAWMPDRQAFAGSVATADRLLRTMVDLAEVKLTEAVRMLTINPARSLGVATDIGSIDRGKFADLVILDDTLNVKATFVAGQLVYCKNQSGRGGEV